jgi:hypothetical protein
MSTSDDYIKTERVESKLGLAGKHAPKPQDAAAQLHITPEAALEAAVALEGLNWSQGLTRDQMRMTYQELPLGIYLRLPDSKRFHSAHEVLHEAGVAASRAEGDFMGANPGLPDNESVADGGPPGWGEQAAVYPPGAIIFSGSAEDTEGLLSDEPDARETIGNE